jgi:hypothetical protein
MRVPSFPTIRYKILMRDLEIESFGEVDWEPLNTFDGVRRDS